MNKKILENILDANLNNESLHEEMQQLKEIYTRTSIATLPDESNLPLKELKEIFPILNNSLHAQDLKKIIEEIDSALKIHDNLIKEISSVINLNEEKYHNFLVSIEARNYSQALRRLCTTTSKETIQVVKLLLKAKNDILLNIDEQAGKEKFSALHYAAKKGNEQVYNLLKKDNADENLEDSYGKTAADYFSKTHRAKDYSAKLLECLLNENIKPEKVLDALLKHYMSGTTLTVFEHKNHKPFAQKISSLIADKNSLALCFKKLNTYLEKNPEYTNEFSVPLRVFFRYYREMGYALNFVDYPHLKKFFIFDRLNNANYLDKCIKRFMSTANEDEEIDLIFNMHTNDPALKFLPDEYIATIIDILTRPEGATEQFYYAIEMLAERIPKIKHKNVIDAISMTDYAEGAELAVFRLAEYLSDEHKEFLKKDLLERINCGKLKYSQPACNTLKMLVFYLPQPEILFKELKNNLSRYDKDLHDDLCDTLEALAKRMSKEDVLAITQELFTEIDAENVSNNYIYNLLGKCAKQLSSSTTEESILLEKIVITLLEKAKNEALAFHICKTFYDFALSIPITQLESVVGFLLTKIDEYDWVICRTLGKLAGNIPETDLPQVIDKLRYKSKTKSDEAYETLNKIMKKCSKKQVQLFITDLFAEINKSKEDPREDIYQLLSNLAGAIPATTRLAFIEDLCEKIQAEKKEIRCIAYQALVHFTPFIPKSHINDVVEHSLRAMTDSDESTRRSASDILGNIIKTGQMPSFILNSAIVALFNMTRDTERSACFYAYEILNKIADHIPPTQWEAFITTILLRAHDDTTIFEEGGSVIQMACQALNSFANSKIQHALYLQLSLEKRLQDSSSLDYSQSSILYSLRIQTNQRIKTLSLTRTIVENQTNNTLFESKIINSLNLFSAEKNVIDDRETHKNYSLLAMMKMS